MALSRLQIRQQRILAEYEAQKRKPPTRKQAKAWIDPLVKALHQLLSGEADAVDDNPVMQIRWSGTSIARIDHAINGFVSMVHRMDPPHPQAQVESLSSLANKLTQGILLTEQEVHDALQELSMLEDVIITYPREKLLDWAMTEQISCAQQLHGQA